MRCEDTEDHWIFTDPKASEETFKSMRPSAQHAGAEEKDGLLTDNQEILTQVARSLGLQKRFDEAKEVLKMAKEEILRLEDADPDEPTLVDLRVARARYLIELGRVIKSGGDPLSSIRYFRMALQITRLGPPERLQHYTVDAIHMLAIVELEEREKIRCGEEALEVCEKSTNSRTQGWASPILNNMGWVHYDQGRFEKALEAFRKAEAWARKRVGAGTEKNFVDRLRVTRWAVARTLRSLERLDEALEIQLELAALPRNDVYVFEELAELYAAKGDMENASRHARLCAEANAESKALDGKRLERITSLASSAREQMSPDIPGHDTP
ncbi:hypothetical protein HDU67_006020 [Dinochytrium kinnereticum]|nr:hypothetical protein HDU67_006020 [Dinochytrium kinnereticum]